MQRSKVVMMFLAIALAITMPLLAAEKSHDGKVVSVTEGTEATNGKLVMTDNEGKNEHSHPIPSTAKITLNGKVAKLGELKKGDSIVVTQDDDKKVTAVAATRK
jgi:co-chaperonin GroES (HSP10)